MSPPYLDLRRQDVRQVRCARSEQTLRAPGLMTRAVPHARERGKAILDHRLRVPLWQGSGSPTARAPLLALPLHVHGVVLRHHVRASMHAMRTVVVALRVGVGRARRRDER